MSENDSFYFGLILKCTARHPVSSCILSNLRHLDQQEQVLYIRRGSPPVKQPLTFRPPARRENMALSRLEKAQTWLFRAVAAFFFMIFQFLSSRSPGASERKLPPVTNPLLLQSATQLAKKIRRKDVCTQLSQAGRRFIYSVSCLCRNVQKLG